MAHIQVVRLPPIVRPVRVPQVQVDPLPPAGPQPDFVNLDQHIDAVKQELGRFANLPGVANLDQIINTSMMVCWRSSKA